MSARLHSSTRWSAALVALVLVSAIALAEPSWDSTRALIEGRFPDVEPISTRALATWLDEDAAPLLLDVREREEFDVSHLRGARLATDRDMAMAVLSEMPSDTTIVVYCSVGYRSARLASQLKRAGYRRVLNLDGALFQWANEDRPLYRDEARVGVVHPYDEQWGQLLDRHRWAVVD